MAFGDMWWVKHEWVGNPPPGVSVSFGPNGLTFSGMVIGALTLGPGVDIGWKVELKSHYFLDPPRMPATGESCISLPKVTVSGRLGVKGGVNEDPDKDGGTAQYRIRFRQILRPGWVDVALAEHVSDADGLDGQVIGSTVVGQQILTPQKRDFAALFFNLDRTQTLGATLVTTFDFGAWFGGVIAFDSFAVGPAPWGIHTLE
jgi:hypothetical protein